jgi:hypothetical protein
MAIRISVTSKLDGVRSWSLQARATCPGSTNTDGSLVPACDGCYAVGGNYRFANVREPRESNRVDWTRDGWEDDMVAELARDTHFRWLDSGDLYALRLAWKAYRVMKRTPWCKHWLPTRMHKFQKFARVLDAMRALPNVMVRPSSDDVDGTYVPGLHGSCIVPTIDALPEGAMLCHAATNDGKCGPCRACYSRDVPVVAYLAHGRSMARVIRQSIALDSTHTLTITRDGSKSTARVIARSAD